MKKFLWMIVFSFLFAMIISACGPSGPEIRVEAAWVRPDPLMENAAGYLIIHNNGGEADTLIGVQAEFFGDVSVHQTVMEGDIHKMEPVPRLDVPPGGQVELKPLSYHLMMMGLNKKLEFGQTVILTLEFEKTGEVIVEAEVRQE